MSNERLSARIMIAVSCRLHAIALENVSIINDCLIFLLTSALARESVSARNLLFRGNARFLGLMGDKYEEALRIICPAYR
jgi:hypothetical protein